MKKEFLHERYTFEMVYRNCLGHVKGRAIARDVRATKTLFIVSLDNVEITSGAIRFGMERRYNRDTLQRVPKPNPFSGNGAWSIERDTVRKMS